MVQVSRERWRKVPGWPYEAAYWGSGVRREGDAVPLTPAVEGAYRCLWLYRVVNGKRERKKFRVHQLVALAWLGPPEVLHGRGGQDDDSVPNLRWGSRRQNELDKSTFGSIQSGRTGLMRVEGMNEKEKRTEGYKEAGVAHQGTTIAAIAGDVQR